MEVPAGMTRTFQFLSSNSMKISQYLFFLETYMRRFIQETLETRFGVNWWERGVPGNIRERCVNRKDADQKSEGQLDTPDVLIEYLDFSDYSEIIGNNWRGIFEKKYKGQQRVEIEDRFDKLLEPIRNAEAHSRLINDDDVKTFKKNVLYLLCDNDFREGFSELVDSLEMLPHTQKDATKAILRIEKLSRGKVKGYDVWDEIPLSTGPVRIGRPSREPDAIPPDIMIVGNDYISRSQAEISYSSDEGCFFIHDNGSRNGTFLNGELLEKNKPYPLKDHDLIGFARISGEIKVLFRFRTSEVTSPP